VGIRRWPASLARHGRRNQRAFAGGLVALALAAVLGVAGAFGAFTATITGNGTFTTGSIVLEENGSSNTCYSAGESSGTILNANSYDCTTIDTFGAPTAQIAGGPANTQTLTFTNVGTLNASSFTVTPGSCTASGSGTFYGNGTSGYCGEIDVTIGNGAGTVCYYPAQSSACPALSSSYTLSGLYSAGTMTIGSGLAANATDTIVVKTELDPSATGADMGLEATQGFTWTLTQ
jgi:hypothetical protein